MFNSFFNLFEGFVVLEMVITILSLQVSSLSYLPFFLLYFCFTFLLKLFQ